MQSRWISIPAMVVLMLLATAGLPASAQSGLKSYVTRYDSTSRPAITTQPSPRPASSKRCAARNSARSTRAMPAPLPQARTLYVLGKYPEAEKARYKLALPIFEKAPPSARIEPRSREDAQRSSARLRAEGRYAEAEAPQKRALEHRRKALPRPIRWSLSDALEDLGNAFYGEGRYAEAEDYYKRTLAIREK